MKTDILREKGIHFIGEIHTGTLSGKINRHTHSQINEEDYIIREMATQTILEKYPHIHS